MRNIDPEGYLRIIQYCRNGAFSVSITYWEASDEMSIEIISAAPNECYSQKRVVSFDHFIACHTKYMDSASQLPNK